MAARTRKRKNLKTEEFRIDGMTCASCERITENQARSINGVVSFKADYSAGLGDVTYDADKTDMDEIFGKINSKGYTCSLSGDASSGKQSLLKSITLVLGAIVVLVGAYLLLGSLEFPLPNFDQNTSLILVFTIGLLTGFHCVAMCGGFVISYTSKDAISRDKGGLRLGSHLSYGLGKTLSYAAIGAVFGFVGSLFTFTPFIRGAAAIIAGLFLVMFGLNMLGLFSWFRRFRLSTPNFVEKLVSRNKSSSPMVIGLLNGLMIACGPLQAMYVLAAASGSAYYGALYLGVFGLGTLPVLLGFGLLTSILSSRLTGRILRYSGVVVVLLGLIMVNRGVALTGVGYDLNTLAVSAKSVDAGGSAASSAGIEMDSSGRQVIRMNVTAYGWSPDRFVLKRGVPVKWIIDGQQITNCNKAIQVPKLGLRFDIKPGLQTIEFTPAEAGVIPWSCWMGMIPGTFIVKDDLNATAPAEAARAGSGSFPSQATPSCGGAGGGGCGGGGCGCGCGGGARK